MFKISFTLISFVWLINIVASSYVQAEVLEGAEIKGFIINSGYGAGIGAAVGLAAVALSDQPSSNSRNIAKGASIGLYLGILYGLSRMQQKEAKSFDWGLEPVLNKNSCDGLRLSATIMKF